MQRNVVLLVILVMIFFILGSWTVKQFVKTTMKMPVNGKVTSPFGNRTHPVTGVAGTFHNGTDIGAPTGTPIFSPASGEVIKKYFNSIGGNSLVIKHDNGFQTGYAHLSAYSVNIGDRVKQGQKIAEVGATGRVTGAHLHLTMRDQNGGYVDPLKHLS